MNRTWKKVITTTLAFALVAGGISGGAALNSVSAAEQPVTATHFTGESAAFAFDAGVYEANAGDTIKVKIRTTDIRDPFCVAMAFLNVNTDYFTVQSVTAGDTDDSDNENSKAFQHTVYSDYVSGNTEKIGLIYSNDILTNEEEEMVLLTVELKINDDAKDGYYELPFSLYSGGDMATGVIRNEYGGIDIKELDPEFRGALIKVGNTSEEVIAGEMYEDEQPEEYEDENPYSGIQIVLPDNYAHTETGQPLTSNCSAGETAAFTVDAGVYEAKPGDIVKVKIKATDIKEAFCVLVAYLQANTDNFSILNINLGDTDDPDNENSGLYEESTVNIFSSDENTETAALVYCSPNLTNRSEDIVLATVEIMVNEDVKEGCYEIPFALFRDGGMATQDNSTDEWYDAKELNPEFLGALIKVASSEETLPEEQPAVTGNEETPAPAEELPAIEEPEKPAGPHADHHHGPAGPGAHKPDPKHDHKPAPAPKPDHRPAPKPDPIHGHEKAVDKITEDITNVITDIAKFIFSLF